MKILIRNLDRSTTEKELRALFIQIGRVQSCDLVLDKATGKSKGFAFVEMPKVGEAKVAIKKFNNMNLAGNKIRVKRVESKPGNKPSNKVEDGDGVLATDTIAPVSSEVSPKKFSWKERKLT